MNNKFLSVISVLSFIFISFGATFSFFTSANGSSMGAVKSKATVVGANVLASVLYNDEPLIPMNDSDVWKAYDNKCIDIYGFGACQAFTVNVENIGTQIDYQGTIKFEVNDITNLNYMVLDEEDNVLVPQTRIVSGTDMKFVDPFTLEVDETRQFKLLIWLTNIDDFQDDIDGGGTYNAIVTFENVFGIKISGSISGS